MDFFKSLVSGVGVGIGIGIVGGAIWLFRPEGFLDLGPTVEVAAEADDREIPWCVDSMQENWQRMIIRREEGPIPAGCVSQVAKAANEAMDSCFGSTPDAATR
jgi:hypothetical protein